MRSNPRLSLQTGLSRGSIAGVVLILCLVGAACSGLRTTPKMSSPDRISMPERHAAFRYVGPDTLNGIFHNLRQFKCPGTKVSEPGAPCIRSLTIYTPTQTRKWTDSRLHRDTIRLQSNEAYVIGALTDAEFLPDSARGAEGMTPVVSKKTKSRSAAVLIGQNTDACTTTETKRYNYDHCDLSSVPAIRLRVSARYLERYTHPLRGPLGRLPVVASSDSVDVVLLVESTARSDH